MPVKNSAFVQGDDRQELGWSVMAAPDSDEVEGALRKAGIPVAERRKR